MRLELKAGPCPAGAPKWGRHKWGPEERVGEGWPFPTTRRPCVLCGRVRWTRYTATGNYVAGYERAPKTGGNGHGEGQGVTGG